ncbi:MAG: hypothetical protein JST89_19565 [Cyanobacteria bacterium SZAS-4]|nr:hypothetical protein [Cyanobacteria bacterium SZAS-4]
MKVTKHTLLLGITSLFAITQSIAADSVLVTPGVGMGVTKLGMTQKKLKQVAGNFDASYVLPSGIKVDRADWKDKGLTTVMLKVFYDRDGKAIQIATAASTAVTADGINKKSSVDEIGYKRNKLKLTEYRAKNGRVDYYDDIAKGIAYEYRRLDEDLARKLYAIIVHKPGVPVLADADERPLKPTQPVAQATK